MLKIRMQRTGRINSPSYRLIVVEHTEGPKTGKIVERIGTYNPATKERKVNTDRVRHWMSVGAKPSDTVHNMLVTIGVLNEKKINVLPKKSPPKKEGEAAAEAAPAAEAPAAEEKKAE
jgi:small subunit ribosomal protein S16